MIQLFETRTGIRLVQSIQWLEKALGKDDKSMKWWSLECICVSDNKDVIFIFVIIQSSYNRMICRLIFGLIKM